MTALLARCRGVTRRFGDFTAVEGVDLNVAAGEVVGLLGANGAGKTTLIRLLLGLLVPTGGHVALFGEAPSRRTRRALGYVPQGLGLYEDLTTAENLAFVRSVFGGGAGPPAWLDGAAGVPIGRLPLGVQRRVAFAAALGHDPRLLVLDEPTSGVDPLARAWLWDTIHSAAESGVGVLVTTHHMDEAEECDRLVILAAGRVVAEGPADRVAAGGTVTVVDADDWASAFAALSGAGLAVALVGRSLRIPGVGAAEVRRRLGPIPARVAEAPATLEERFFELVSSGAGGRSPRP